MHYPGLLSKAAAHASRIHREAVEAKEAERARIAVSELLSSGGAEYDVEQE